MVYNVGRKALVQAVHEMEKVLDSMDISVQSANFWVLEGEAGVSDQIIHHTVRIRFTAASFLSRFATINNMLVMRNALLDLGYKTYWSCLMTGNKRAISTFTFEEIVEGIPGVSNTNSRERFVGGLNVNVSKYRVDVPWT